MELNINSPAYFTNHYGVDDEVYRYCQNLHNYFKTPGYLNGITGEYAPPAGYLVNEKEAEAFDREFPYMEKKKLLGQIFE